MSVSEKRSAVNPTDEKLTIKRQCELMDLPRSSFYRVPAKGESDENLKLMRLIDEEYTRHPFKGTRGIRDYLIRQGHKTGENSPVTTSRTHDAWLS